MFLKIKKKIFRQRKSHYKKAVNISDHKLPHGILKIPKEFSKNEAQKSKKIKTGWGRGRTEVRDISDELRQMGIIQKTKNIYGWQININYDCARLREQ